MRIGGAGMSRLEWPANYTRILRAKRGTRRRGPFAGGADPSEATRVPAEHHGEEAVRCPNSPLVPLYFADATAFEPDACRDRY